MSAPNAKDGARFCTACGERLGGAARFCGGCGAPAANASSTATAPARGTQLPGLVVLAFFLVAGLLVWAGVIQPSAPASRAPGRGGPAGGERASTAGGGGDMPSDHPPVGLPDEAKKFVTQLTEKAKAAPQDVAAWKSLAQVQSRAGEMEPSYFALALESWQHVVELAPDDDDAVRGIGNVYYDQQKFDLAAAQYEKYLAKHGDDASVRTDLATTYLYQRQIDKALAAYQDAIKAKPDFLQAHFNLGLAYEAKGDREHALAALDKARSLATDDETRDRIDRVRKQLEATPVGAAAASIATTGGGPAGGGAPAGMGAAAPPAGSPPHGPATNPNAPPATGADFPSQVEAQLRAHQILGPKIQKIEWPEPARARVLVADFPMQSMPEFARNLFKTRLDTILNDAKQKFGVSDTRTIEIVDTASGSTMETVSK